ncbi:MAG TPA: SRPBCC domain-containing protein [Rhizomicrobium sp.]|nr:SRPBCC domain-containing protein [Rhizomicrobium sp.]
MADEWRRREFGALLAGAGLAAGLGKTARASEPHENEGLTSSAEAIHQEIDFDVPRARVYGVLLDAKAFYGVVKLGRAYKSNALPDIPASIDPTEGGAFALFGGFIQGRNVELVPGKRIVQAWREESWDKGAYSLVRFAFEDRSAGCRIVFDHTGFPKGAGGHLSSGWYADYWDPMRAYLAVPG